MLDLAAQLIHEVIPGSKVSLYWLGGVGYIIKTNKITLGLDLYLSNSCMNKNGDFKRLIPSLMDAKDIELDYLIATHDHGDHFDVGSIQQFINDGTKTRLIGPDSVINAGKELGLAESKLVKLDRNEQIAVDGIKIRGVFADHGEYSPDAIGVIIEIEGKSIYFTGDTCYRVDFPQLVPIKDKIDLLIVPINGKFGNPDAKDASYITAWVKPQIVIPCHFWMFKEHGGDPGEFVKCCQEIAPSSKIVIPAIGEEFLF